jgi:exonuclease VII small subunit
LSKKSSKKRQPQVELKKGNSSFGYEEMLTELEAIVADAELRLEDEEAA